MTMVDQELFLFLNLVSLSVACSTRYGTYGSGHPHRDCRLCLAEGFRDELRHVGMKGITSGKTPPVGRKLSYSPDIQQGVGLTP